MKWLIVFDSDIYLRSVFVVFLRDTLALFDVLGHRPWPQAAPHHSVFVLAYQTYRRIFKVFYMFPLHSLACKTCILWCCFTNLP